jgi:23S rRNA pseudouridine955/2504/2580 synthase
MNTSGIVIAAKNAESLRIMNQKIKDRELKKLYICAVHGTPKKKSATLKNYLIKDEKQNKVTVYNTPRPNAKTIIRHFDVNGKYCPARMVDESKWKKFLKGINAI